MSGKTGNMGQILVISLACLLNYILGHLGATDRLETLRPAHMRQTRTSRDRDRDRDRLL